jgi:hypothetical protein
MRAANLSRRGERASRARPGPASRGRSRQLSGCHVTSSGAGCRQLDKVDLTMLQNRCVGLRCSRHHGEPKGERRRAGRAACGADFHNPAGREASVAPRKASANRGSPGGRPAAAVEGKSVKCRQQLPSASAPSVIPARGLDAVWPSPAGSACILPCAGDPAGGIGHAVPAACRVSFYLSRRFPAR